MKTSTSEGKHEIQWTAQNQLDDLDFADDLAHLSHTQQQIYSTSIGRIPSATGFCAREQTKFPTEEEIRKR
ncbi:unnamed protein product [Schistosoma margrebowiei]|uniref:Uncharacterized protein n=1 Tax=Schistosoma margrebowiei TaxID=48269 RepID=A0A183LCR9_9TREM|nr:unnamed protein product [Schistosoma margrebowiei]